MTCILSLYFSVMAVPHEISSPEVKPANVPLHYVCCVCTVHFSTNLELQKHKKSHMCSMCVVAIKWPQELRAHERCHYSSFGPWMCHNCCKTFQTRDQIMSHIREVHRYRRPHRCSIYRAIRSLRTRIKSSQAIVSFKCPRCEVAFSKVSILRKLVKPPSRNTQHNNLKGIFWRFDYHLLSSCSVKLCFPKEELDRRFISKHNLQSCSVKLPKVDKKFVRLISGMNWTFRPFTCEICREHFQSFRKLKFHRATFHKKKLYECDICQARFTWWCNLKRHRKVHTQEGLYECTLCGRGFVWPYSCKIHVKNHFLAKVPLMPDLGFLPSWLKFIKTHRRFHVGEQPYDCKICYAASVFLNLNSL